MKKIILFILLLLFSGCSTKVSEIFNKDNKYITLSQYTKRGEIVQSFETLATISVTYLNPILGTTKDTKKYEIFIIGVYNNPDYKGYKKGGIFNNHYELTMNNVKFVKAEQANKLKLNLEDYPFYNKWMKYYKVYFPRTNSTNLSIKYLNKTTKNSITLTIPKHIYLK